MPERLGERPPRMERPKAAAANHPQGDADGLGKLHRSTMAIPRKPDHIFLFHDDPATSLYTSAMKLCAGCNRQLPILHRARSVDCCPTDLSSSICAAAQRCRAKPNRAAKTS